MNYRDDPDVRRGPGGFGDHSELCACRKCVTDLSLSGQVEPCGWMLVVRWSTYDNLADTSESEGADTVAYRYASHGMPVAQADLDYGQEQMDALTRRIHGKKFYSAQHLSNYLTGSLGLPREDFA